MSPVCPGDAVGIGCAGEAVSVDCAGEAVSVDCAGDAVVDGCAGDEGGVMCEVGETRPDPGADEDAERFFAV